MKTMNLLNYFLTAAGIQAEKTAETIIINIPSNDFEHLRMSKPQAQLSGSERKRLVYLAQQGL
jgi:hypothetical protein